MRNFRAYLSELKDSEVELLQMALEVAPRALNPVSHFYVGSAVRAANGLVYKGTFFESSSFPLGICAESAALSAAVTDGIRDFTAIAVVGGDPKFDGQGEPVTPCGGCRQRIFDVMGGVERNVPVFCADLALSYVQRFTICDLLPFAFSANDLPTT
jgi:cytidine deaminase